MERIANASPSYPIRSLPWLRLLVRRFRVRDQPSLFPFLHRQLLATVRSSPVSPSSPGDSDKENSNEGSFESAQQVVTELVEIQEVEDKDAKALSDAMDEEVRSRLFQRCRSKNHPSRFLPYPAGRPNGFRPREQQRTFQRGGAERERFVRTRNLREGLLGDTDVESDHSGSSSGDD